MKALGNNFIRNFVVALFFLAALSSFRAVHADVETIDNFNAKIIVENSGTVDVRETIVYDFGSNQKHGIFRDVPLSANNGPRLVIQVLEVADEAGRSYRYAVSENGNVLDIKIGDPGAFVSGVKTYVVTYRVWNAIRTFSDHDELYWNATGDQWRVGIKTADVLVALPTSSIPGLKMDCFTGSHGSTQKSCLFGPSTADPRIVSYAAKGPLNVGEGLTIVLGLPLGYIHNLDIPSVPVKSVGNLSSGHFLFLLFPIIFFIFIIFTGLMILLLFRNFRGKNAKPIIPRELKNQPIVVEYNPPDSLPPIEVGALLDRRVDITDISSVIMDLAVRGYLKIRYTVEQIRFWPDKKDFELVKLKDGTDLVYPADKIIFELLFSGRSSVRLSDLKEQKTTFQSDIKKIQENTEQHLHDEGYFDQAAEDKSKKLKTSLSIATVVLFIGIFISKIFPSGLKFVLIALFMGAVTVLSVMVARLAHKLTSQGLSTLRKILGFREFLQLTEKDKLQLLNAPELQPEMFEKFLPYAMVFGVENKWAQKFEGIYNTIPNWYEDPTATSFNSYVLARNLILFSGSLNQVFSITSPRSSSGFGGGGFSGGGSGGGGGGSW